MDDCYLLNMNKCYKIYTVILFFVAGLTVGVKAQSTADLQKKYAGEQAVVIAHSLYYHISLRDGQPLVQSEENQQILYLSSESGAYFSKYDFYHGSFDTVQQYSAYTRTAEGKKIRVTDFKTTHNVSKGIFYDDIKETSFDFPAITPGAIGILDISTIHKDPHLLSPFYFSRGVPVAGAELKISFPKSMTVRYVLKGNDTGRVVFRQEEKHGEIIYTFQVKDYPADKPYPDAPSSPWYRPHVVFYIEKYLDQQGQPVNYLSSPDDLFRLDQGYLKNINKQTGPELKFIVDSLCRNSHSPEEKARKIYGWVQQNIRYIAFEQGLEGFIPRDANLVCSRRFGDCKDMSSILTTMLRAAGLEAYYTWIGTRGLPYTYAETPLPIVDNHMISTLRLGQQYIFLDATDPNCAYGMPTEMIQDKQAMVAISDSTYKILTVPVVAKESNLLTDTTTLDLTDKGLKGNISTDLTGYFSMSLQRMLTYLDPNDKERQIKERFKRGSNKFQLESYQVGDRSDKAHIRLTGTFTLQDYAKHIGNDWYLNMNLFKFYEHEEIDYPKRKTPIEFDYRYRRKYVVVLNIPQGYHISYKPAGKSYHNAVWGFEISYETKTNQLIFTQEFDNDHLLLTEGQFSDWNKVLENLFPLYKETISITAN